MAIKDWFVISSIFILTILHSEQPKLYGVVAVLSTIGLMKLTRKSLEIKIVEFADSVDPDEAAYSETLYLH